MKRMIIILGLLTMATGFSQEKGKFVEKGNEDFKKGNFAEAEAKYRIAHSQNTSNSTAYYNLGNSIYRQGTGSEAKYAYAKAIDVAKTKEEKHRAYHNIGNVYMHEKNYQAAVEAYKNALRNNPHDEETRYNYALAKEMLKNNPPPPPPFRAKDRDKNMDRKKSDKDQKNKAPEGKGNERDMAGNNGDRPQKQDTQGNDKEGKSGMGNRDNMPASEAPSEQRIKHILDAVNNEEKKVMDRVNRKNSKGDPAQPEKDW
jgi:tetratricopeptide (TPR) repeat protein